MQSPSEVPPHLLGLLLVLPGLVVAQSLVSLVTAWLSGWVSLASQFRAKSDPTQEERMDRPVWVRFPHGLNRRPVLRVQFIPTRQGLCLTARIMTRIGRAPLLIPWEGVRIGRSEDSEPSAANLILGEDSPMILRIKENFRRQISLWKSRAGY